MRRGLKVKLCGTLISMFRERGKGYRLLKKWERKTDNIKIGIFKQFQTIKIRSNELES